MNGIGARTEPASARAGARQPRRPSSGPRPRPAASQQSTAFLVQPGFRAVVCEQRRLSRGDLGKLAFEGCRGAGVQLLPPATQQRAVSGILHRCVLESVLRVGRGPATNDQLAGSARARTACQTQLQFVLPPAQVPADRDGPAATRATSPGWLGVPTVLPACSDRRRQQALPEGSHPWCSIDALRAAKAQTQTRAAVGLASRAHGRARGELWPISGDIGQKPLVARAIAGQRLA
jgi:hypothetical protein